MIDLKIGRIILAIVYCENRKSNKKKPTGCVSIWDQETIKIKTAATIKATTMDQWAEETLAVETEGIKKVGIT